MVSERGACGAVLSVDGGAGVFATRHQRVARWTSTNSSERALAEKANAKHNFFCKISRVFARGDLVLSAAATVPCRRTR